MKGPSPHLTWEELGCKDGTPYPEMWCTSRALILAAEFEAVRAIYGAPLRVLSAYRSEAHNKAVGGARFSQHVEGRALDLQPIADGKSGKVLFADMKLYSMATALARLEHAIRRRNEVAGALVIGGLGIYPSFVHMDTRGGTRLAVWNGARLKADGVAS